MRPGGTSLRLAAQLILIAKSEFFASAETPRLAAALLFEPESNGVGIDAFTLTT